MEQITIRQATSDDFEAIGRLFEQGDRHHENILPAYFQVVKGARSFEHISAFIAREDADYFVAEKAGVIVGIMNLQKSHLPKLPFFRACDFALIDSIVVDEQHRNQGIGELLLRRAKEWAADHDLNKIQLTVWEANESALRFYQKHGFETLSRKMQLELKTRETEE